MLLGGLVVGVVGARAWVSNGLPHCGADQRVIVKLETHTECGTFFGLLNRIVVGSWDLVTFGKISSLARTERPAGHLLLGGVDLRSVSVRRRVVTSSLSTLLLTSD